MPRRRRVAGAGLGSPDVQPLSVAAKLTHLTSRNENNQARAVIPAALQCQLHWVVAISQKWDPRSLPRMVGSGVGAVTLMRSVSSPRPSNRLCGIQHNRLYVPCTIMWKTGLPVRDFPCGVRVWRIRSST